MAMKRSSLVVLVALGVVWVVLSVLVLGHLARPGGALGPWGGQPGRAPAPRQLADQEPAGELTEVFRIEGLFPGVVCGDLYGDGTAVILAAGYERFRRPEPGQLDGKELRYFDPLAVIRVYDLKGGRVSAARPAGGEMLRFLCSPAMAQLDSDPEKEVVLFGLATENVSAHDADGSELWSHEVGFAACVAVVDTDGDGADEVVVGRPIEGVKLLDSDGSVLWENSEVFGSAASVGAGDLDGDGRIEIVAEGHPRLRRRDLLTPLRRPSALINCLTVLDAQGERVALYEAPVAMTRLLVAELVATAPGPELIVWGITIPGDDARLAVLSGRGRVLWQVSVGQGLDVMPSAAAVGAGHVAALTGEGKLLVFTDQGELVAQETGFERMSAVAVAADASGRPLVVVASSEGLFGYTLSTADTPPEAEGGE